MQCRAALWTLWQSPIPFLGRHKPSLMRSARPKRYATMPCLWVVGCLVRCTNLLPTVQLHALAKVEQAMEPIAAVLRGDSSAAETGAASPGFASAHQDPYKALVAVRNLDHAVR